MDLNREWDKINREKFSSQHITKDEIMKAISQESSLTINELKKRLKYKIYWIFFFLAAFTAGLLLSLNYPGTLPVWGIFLALYLAGFLLIFQQYRRMDDGIDPGVDTLTVMKKNAALIKKALSREKQFGFFLIPVALICGLLLPSLYRGESLTEILSDTTFVLVMLGLLIVLPPLMHLLSNKMNETAYDRYIRQLEENIRKMEEVR